MPTTYNAEPFPHWTFDDFLPPETAWKAYHGFYDGDGGWVKRNHLYCRGKETRTDGLHPDVESVLATLEGPTMSHYFAKVADLPKLEHDPDRFGGGQHVIRRDGFLGIHADFTHHPSTGMRRVLNLLLYLNAHWKPGDGGELELWAPDMSRCVKKIEPLFNRAVLFKTSTTSFHGHPEPLQHDERRSLAVYYYVKDEPGSIREWLRTTDYRPRPWEYKLKLRRWLSRNLKGW